MYARVAALAAVALCMAYGGVLRTASNLTVDVVVIPHSHDDAGWQRTFEGYYQDETRHILDNVIAWLNNNPSAKFIWVESSFLQRWWLDQNATTQAAFRRHLGSGRLELVGGGWTMHDEESTNVYSAVSNMEYGLTWLADTFGPQYRPRVLWQIDPSGHSVLTPTLAASLGYDLLVLDRVPDPVRQAMRAQQGLQFVWTAVNSSLYAKGGAASAVPSATTSAVGTASQAKAGVGGAGTSILSFVLEEFYCSPSLGNGNVSSQAQQFYVDALRRASMMRPDSNGHVTILWPWGCDFAFQHYSDFSLMEGVLGYLASNASAFPGVTARFGTLADFVDTLHSQDIVFPTMGTRDFHPYVWCYEPNNPSLCYNLPTTPDPAYWRSGMYTSKVGLKGLSRVLDAAHHGAETLLVQARLQAAAGAAAARAGHAVAALRGSSKTITAVSSPLADKSTWLPSVGNARATGALMTHHDAITGTAYISCSLGPPDDDCNCFQDYMDRMTGAVGGAAAAAGDMAGYLLAKPGVAPSAQPSFGNATEATAGLSTSNVLMVTVNNPLGWARREIVRLPLLASGFNMPVPIQEGVALTLTVTDLRTSSAVLSQVVYDPIRNTSTMYFLSDVPALGSVVYAVAASAAVSTDSAGAIPATAAAAADVTGGTDAGAPIVLDNGAVAITYDATGRIASWTNHSSGITLPLQHAFYLYPEKMAGGDLIGGTVYGFEPLDDKHPVLVGPGVNGTGAIPVTLVANGPLVWEATQAVAPYLTHTVRLFAPVAEPPAGTGYAATPAMGYSMEWQTQVLPLPFTNGTGGSLVSAFSAGSGCGFSTASDGPSSPYTSLTTDASGFQVLSRPSYNVSQYAQGQVYPAWPGWDWSFGPCDGSAAPGGGPSLLSHTMQRPTGTAVMGNASVWTMLHRRIVNPSDDRGNDTTVIYDVIAVGVADPSSGWQADPFAVLLPRQVQGRLMAHPLGVYGALYPSVAAYSAVGNAAYSPPWLSGALPNGVHLHSVVSRERWYPPAPNTSATAAHDAAGVQVRTAGAAASVQIGLRLQQLPYGPAVTVDLAALVTGAGYTLISANETTPDFNAGKAASDAARYTWRTETVGVAYVSAAEGGQHGMPVGSQHAPGRSTPAGPVPVSFDAEYVRSYLLQLQPPA